MKRPKINCLWGCQRRYFGENASAFVIQYDPGRMLVGCNQCHRQKWVVSDAQK